MQVQKTVFISYRRTNIFTARAVYQHLTAHGYDAFLDYENIDSGAFDRIILNQIAARAHFVLVLTPSALERCAEPEDWLRREIEHAMALQRNIVPLMFEDFDFRQVEKYLVSPQLQTLKQYNGLRVPSDYFDEAMTRLRERFLNKPLEMILHPTPPSEQAEVAQRQAAAAAAPTVTERQLSAEEYFERAYQAVEAKNYDSGIADYSEALRLNPQYATAYNNRGVARDARGDYDRAIDDYSEALRLNPQYADAYNNRGLARHHKGDIDGAIADYNEALRLNPQSDKAYNNRGNALYDKGDLDGAIADYNEAIRLNSQDARTYNNRGEVYFALNRFSEALADFKCANELRPAYSMTLAGMGVTHHALGELQQAKAIWGLLLKLDARYGDADWVGKEHSWHPSLIEEARKLIAAL